MTGSERHENLFSVEGKTAVVTGGSRGIGAMITSGLLRAGIKKVYICGRKKDELLRAAAVMAAIREAEAISTVTCDLGSAEGVAALVDFVSEREEAVELLFNNAGTNWGAPLEDFPESGWDKILALNLKGPFLLTQSLLPQLRAASVPGDPARVINVGSIDGIRVPRKGFNNFSYAASKAGLHMLTRQLAGDLAPDVLVNAMAPGLFESKMTASILSGGHKAVAEQMPLRRIGSPDDIAGASIFLASKASAYITGAVIPIDGGVSDV